MNYIYKFTVGDSFRYLVVDYFCIVYLPIVCLATIISFKLLFVVTAGLSDDDLRETAYEVLLVSVGAAGYSFVLFYMHSICADLGWLEYFF